MSSSGSAPLKKAVGKPPASSPPDGKRSAASATRPEKSRTLAQLRDESGSKGKPVLAGSAPRTEKPKQPLQSVKREDSSSKGKEVKKTIVVSKQEVKGKAPLNSSSKTVTKITKTTKKTTTRKKTEKKVYSLPGQKHDPPEEREPLRIFYESLSKQIPSSEMAEFWMMEHGLLPHDKAKKAYERKQRKPSQFKISTPVKIAESSKKPQLVNNGSAKRKVNYSDDKTKRARV
ncbi:hypothetical protein LUZ60_001062 [Juncus effusus]|nr:hypothetical protein LUZ60_001062 [Juncus effusus]